MLIDAVTVCVGYSDFLEETLQVNLPHFNRLVVVTSLKDGQTRAVCRKYSVECRSTDTMHHNGMRFAKARAIDYGLAFLASSHWVLHLDADIALPPGFKHALAMRPMNEAYLYGADRVNCDSFADWRGYLAGNRYQYSQGYLVSPPAFKPAARLAIQSYGGFVPPGYFQLWHSSTGRRYPTTQRDGAEHTDVLHAIQWEPHERIMIPELYVVHLNSMPSDRWGANWRGRTAPPFRPGELAKGADANVEGRHRDHHHRDHHHHHERRHHRRHHHNRPYWDET